MKIFISIFESIHNLETDTAEHKFWLDEAVFDSNVKVSFYFTKQRFLINFIPGTELELKQNDTSLTPSWQIPEMESFPSWINFVHPFLNSSEHYHLVSIISNNHSENVHKKIFQQVI